VVIGMTIKKLTVAQIKEVIMNIESRYYKGWKESEYWWRVYGDVHPEDRRLWTKYTKLLNERMEETDDD
jgi:hypothetical protein